MMHLIRTTHNKIEDLEKHVTYNHVIRGAGVETATPDNTEIYITRWFPSAEEEEYHDVAFGQNAVAFWAYLESLLVFDTMNPNGINEPPELEALKSQVDGMRGDFEKLHEVVKELDIRDHHGFVVDTVVDALRKAYK